VYLARDSPYRAVCEPPLTRQDGIDLIERRIDLLPDLRPGDDDLARDEDQEHDLGLDHTVDETGEQLRSCQARPGGLASQNLGSQQID
jgi:hypothetical protein